MSLTNQQLLECITPYLPYVVKAYDENQEIKTDTIVGIYGNVFDFANWSPINSHIQNYKLVLRPLSDLTKPCLEGGEVPILKLIKYVCNDKYIVVNIQNYNNTCTALFTPSNDPESKFFLDIDIVGFGIFYGIVRQADNNGINNDKYLPINNILGIMKFLYKHHFDIHGLIQQGYAIDINTINTK